MAVGARPLKPPSLTPRALAAASASLVRFEIILALGLGDDGHEPTTISLASGMSTATNLTPAFCRPSRKCASRDRRPSLAITSVAPCVRALDIAGPRRGPVGGLERPFCAPYDHQDLSALIFAAFRPNILQERF
jgi:hypothetical protein